MGDLETTTDDIIETLSAASAARDAALSDCRRITRASANAIRALHRDDVEAARVLLDEARELLAATLAVLAEYPSIRWAGFVHDAQKEFAEAHLTMAVFARREPPRPADLGVSDVAWLHGVAECIGELRRSALDLLRLADIEAAEQRLATMDAMYQVLTRVDFPDAMTGGLRRATDVGRGIVERTRADITNAAVQRRLELAIARHLDSR